MWSCAPDGRGRHFHSAARDCEGMARARPAEGPVTGIDAVRAYFMLRAPGASVAAFTDDLTRLHGTVGFDVAVGDSVSTVEVAVELLDPHRTGRLVASLQRGRVVELLAEHPIGVIVTADGARVMDASPAREASRVYDAPPTPEPMRPDRPNVYLVVEDDPHVAEVVVTYLETLGHLVCSVGRGSDADRIAAEWRFDAVVVDVHLPDGDGLEWLQASAQSARGVTGTIVVYSGTPLTDHQMKVLSDLNAVFLGKPFALRALAEALGIAPRASGSG